MRKKFDTKEYRGKNRIAHQVPGRTGITRLWVWNARKMEYVSPPYGKPYVARKRNLDGRRQAKSFTSLDEAWEWLRSRLTDQYQGDDSASTVGQGAERPSPEVMLSLSELIQKWKAERWPHLSESTRILYTNRLRAFDPFLTIEVESITPSTVDAFFAHLRSPSMTARYKKNRSSFDKEIELFKNLLNWYRKTHDEARLSMPFREKHEDMIVFRSLPRNRRSCRSTS